MGGRFSNLPSVSPLFSLSLLLLLSLLFPSFFLIVLANVVKTPPVSALSNAVRAIFEFALRVSSLLSLSPPSSLSPFSFFLFNCFGQRCENTAGLGAKQCRQGDFRICPPSLLSSLSLSSFSSSSSC